MREELFPRGEVENLLPYEGEVLYYPGVFSGGESSGFLERLIREVEWEQEELVMFGKRMVMARKVAWFCEDGISYSYSGTQRKVHEFPEVIEELRDEASRVTGAAYNSCLANLYHNGGEGMGWHADDEKSIVAGSSIASISFGVERKFSFKHRRTKEVVSLQLGNGSVLEMRGEVQQHWVHQLPKTKKVEDVRVNLTFRMVRNV